MTAVVNFIDKTAPVPVLTYSANAWTKDDVTVTLAFTDEDGPVTIVNNEGSAKYVFKETAASYSTTATGGNEGEVTAQVAVIDRTPPTATILYSEAGWTNHDVTATLVAQDNSGLAPTVVNNAGQTAHVLRKTARLPSCIRMRQAISARCKQAQIGSIKQRRARRFNIQPRCP